MRRFLLLGSVLLGSVLSACGSGGGWSEVSGPAGLLGAVDVWAFSKSDVWVLDGSATVQRYDGAAWSTLATPSKGGLSCIFARSSTEVWLCAGEEVLRYDGTSFQAMDVSAVGLGSLSDLWASSPNDLWIVGDQAILGHYDGTRWTGTRAGSPFNVSVWGSGPSDVYALGTFDLVHYDGTTWTNVDIHAGGDDARVFGTSASDVWVSGSSELNHFDGMTWTTVETTGFVGDISAIWGPAPNDLWGVGSAGAIAHYDGKTWSEVTHQAIGSPYLRQFLAVHGSSATDVWAVGQQLGEGGSIGVIYRH